MDYFGLARLLFPASCEMNRKQSKFECNRLIYKKGCQEHSSSFAGSAVMVRGIQSLVSYEERLIRVFRPVVFRFSLFQLSGCIFVSGDDADRFPKLASGCGCTVSTKDLSEARGLVLFRVVREGIGISQRLSASGTMRLQAIRMLTLEPKRLKNQLATTRQRSPEMEGLFTRDAQAACDFSLSASKFSPFFQSVSVMAAILRANVRRTMVGLMPLASEFS